MLSYPKLNLQPTHFRINELIVAMMVEPMIYRTCAAGCRGRRYEDKTQLSEGVLALDRVERFSTITSIGCDKKLYYELPFGYSFHSE